jgi:hypothetical protein
VCRPRDHPPVAIEREHIRQSDERVTGDRGGCQREERGFAFVGNERVAEGLEEPRPAQELRNELGVHRPADDDSVAGAAQHARQAQTGDDLLPVGDRDAHEVGSIGGERGQELGMPRVGEQVGARVGRDREQVVEARRINAFDVVARSERLIPHQARRGRDRVARGRERGARRVVPVGIEEGIGIT